MTRLHLLPRIFARPRTVTADAVALPRPRRLIVLVPDIEFDVNRTARRARELSNLLDRHIQFLGICRDETHEPAIRRELVTLSSIARDDRISVEVKVEPGLDWLQAVQAHWQPGDRIAIFEGQRIGLRQRRLADLLESRLNATVYILPLPPGEVRRRSKLAGRLLGWPGSLAIVALFFWLQVKLTELPQDWASNSFVYISLIAEVGLIVLWNAICS